MSYILFAKGANLVPVFWACLSMLAAVGLLAVLSPPWFGKLCGRSNRWIDTDKLLEPLNRQIDVDHHIMPYTRLLGVAVLAASVLIGYLYLTY